VAGLRRPADESPAERTGETPAISEVRKPRPRPVPQPLPRLTPVPATSEPLSDDALSTEDTQVFEPVEAPADESRPAPRRKKRDTGIAKPVDIEEAEAAISDVDEKPARRLDRPYIVAGALVVVGLLLSAAAVIFHLQAAAIEDSTSNTALLDVAKTAQVKDQVSKAVETLFSYDYNNVKKTEDAANDLLVNNDVKNKYNLLIGQVKQLAPQQKLVVTCKVTRSAVIMLNGDLANVMVFVDQTSTRADTNKTTAGSAQLHVNAQLQGDKWKITDMDTYKAPEEAQPPASSSTPPSPSPSK
jgi:Mce-associated membrane protein